MARTTLATTNARLDSVEAKLDRLIAALETKAPAKKVTRKVTTTKAKATKALTKGTRKAFIAAASKDGYDFEGFSTKALAFYAVENNYAPKGFHIGEGYLAMFS